MLAHITARGQLVLDLLQSAPVINSPASGVILSPLGATTGVVACTGALVTGTLVTSSMAMVLPCSACISVQYCCSIHEDHFSDSSRLHSDDIIREYKR